MAPAAQFKDGNQLLQRLSKSDLSLLEPHFFSVSLVLRQELERPNKPIADVFFMDRGIASVVTRFPGGVEAEIGIIGCEGMTGTAVVLGNHQTPTATYIQLAGDARRISANLLRSAMDESSTLRPLLLKFVQAFTVQSANTAVANARATLPVRLARWLLMTLDRVPGNDIHLTQEFLSTMLAVRRAGVTEAIKSLRTDKLISTTRGEISVLKRKALEKLAGHFYGVPGAEYRRLMS